MIVIFNTTFIYDGIFLKFHTTHFFFHNLFEDFTKCMLAKKNLLPLMLASLLSMGMLGQEPTLCKYCFVSLEHMAHVSLVLMWSLLFIKHVYESLTWQCSLVVKNMQ